jgi:Kef-type K+ transport system membrane component KefB
MGIMVVNRNIKKEKIFKILERYTEELIFVLFFTISAMHLDFSVLTSNYLLIVIFIIFRSAGKFSGTILGGKISKSSPAIQKFTAGGLLPQGGIVIGLALVIKQNPSFGSISDIILNVIIGATIIHEIIGPIASKIALKKAGEIS